MRLFMGGTFDPVHHGHLIVARCLAEQIGVGLVTLVPAAQPPHKHNATACVEDRLAMLRLAVAGDKQFDICELELHRQGPSYTFDTLTVLREQLGASVRLGWIIGADMVHDLPKWHKAGEVLDLAEIIIAARPPWQERLAETLTTLKGFFKRQQIDQLRDHAVVTPLVDISSTMVRQRVAQGLSIRYLVPESVESYIAAHRRYGEGPTCRQKD